MFTVQVDIVFCFVFAALVGPAKFFFLTVHYFILFFCPRAVVPGRLSPNTEICVSGYNVNVTSVRKLRGKAKAHGMTCFVNLSPLFLNPAVRLKDRY